MKLSEHQVGCLMGIFAMLLSIGTSVLIVVWLVNFILEVFS